MISNLARHPPTDGRCRQLFRLQIPSSPGRPKLSNCNLCINTEPTTSELDTTNQIKPTFMGGSNTGTGVSRPSTNRAQRYLTCRNHTRTGNVNLIYFCTFLIFVMIWIVPSPLLLPLDKSWLRRRYFFSPPDPSPFLAFLVQSSP